MAVPGSRDYPKDAYVFFSERSAPNNGLIQRVSVSLTDWALWILFPPFGLHRLGQTGALLRPIANQ
jgi:hypothetical protein